MMKAELTAENRPACVHPDSAFSTEYRGRATDEDKGCVQVLVVLFRVIAIKLSGFSAVYSEEVGARVIGPQRVEELFESGMEAVLGCQSWSGCTVMPNGLCVPFWIYSNDCWVPRFGLFLRGPLMGGRGHLWRWWEEDKFSKVGRLMSTGVNVAPGLHSESPFDPGEWSFTQCLDLQFKRNKHWEAKKYTRKCQEIKYQAKESTD